MWVFPRIKYQNRLKDVDQYKDRSPPDGQFNEPAVAEKTIYDCKFRTVNSHTFANYVTQQVYSSVR